MKFKEDAIKPSMVIHCPKEEDAMVLFEKIGQDTENCFWNEYAEKTCYKIRKMSDGSFQVSYQSIDYFNSYNITEFSDLIEPENSIETVKTNEAHLELWQQEGEEETVHYLFHGSEELLQEYLAENSTDGEKSTEMTTVEVLEWLKYAGKGTLVSLFGTVSCDEILLNNTPQEIVDKITAYEATKKTPKPVEVEWVDICKIYKLTDEEGIIGECVYEEVLPDNDGYVDYQNAENILKKYISEHEGRYIAMNEDICRVKEDK